MRARAFSWFVALPVALTSLGCSWSRYDDVVENSPIVLLNRPKALSAGFGSSLATARFDDQVSLLVGGSPLTSGGAEFKLGSGDAPGQEALDVGHCLGGDNPCYFSPTPVALSRAKGPSSKPENLCFVDGAGTGSGDQGLVVRCVDSDVEYALGLPAGATKLLSFSITNAQPTLFRFGADRGPDPALLASADEEREVWFYPPLSRDFVTLDNPAESRGRWNKDQPRTLAIARVGGDAKLLAVGAPDESAVRLFLAADGVTPSYIGCLGGTPKFGRAFAAGRVDADDIDELVVSDESRVFVFDGKQLASLPPTTSADCSLAALPEGTLVTSFTCGSTKNISDCPTSEFGASLGVGDLDGDGDGEVVVGAPSMTVRHQSRAGAVLIYDVEKSKSGASSNLYDLTDIAFLSSAEPDDQLGFSVALPDLGERQVLAAGAPGGGKAALFYCPSFLPDRLKGDRCR